MRGTPKKGPRLGGDSAHQRAMLSNLAASLFAAEAIVTTEARARALRPFAERLITRAKKGGLHNIRLIIKELRDKEMAFKLINEIAPRYEERPGGYLRVIKAGYRHGDNAPLCRVELV